MAKTILGYPAVFRSVVDEDPDGFFRWNLEQAREGRVDSAYELLHGFCDSVEQNRPIPRSILDYLYQAIAEYLTEQQPIEKALLLTRPAHRPPSVLTVDPIQAVATLYLYVKRDGLGKEEAKDRTCGLGLSRRSLERYDSAWNHIKDLSVPDLEVLAQPIQTRRNSR